MPDEGKWFSYFTSGVKTWGSATKFTRSVISSAIRTDLVETCCEDGCQVRSHCPSRLRRGSAAVRLLGLRVRIPPVAWMSVSCERLVLSSRGPCYGPSPRPEESYRLCCLCAWFRNFKNEAALARFALLHQRRMGVTWNWFLIECNDNFQYWWC